MRSKKDLDLGVGTELFCECKSNDLKCCRDKSLNPAYMFCTMEFSSIQSSDLSLRRLWGFVWVIFFVIFFFPRPLLSAVLCLSNSFPRLSSDPLGNIILTPQQSPDMTS